MNIELKIESGAKLPVRANPTDAGLDLCAYERTVVLANEIKAIRTGVSMNIPFGFVGLLFSRSGHAKRGLRLANCVGVIDAGYQGEILVLMKNDDTEPQLIQQNERIAQLVVIPCYYPRFTKVDDFSETTARGQSGFGSTGL
jgi:dUTP pyrophosphatase